MQRKTLIAINSALAVAVIGVAGLAISQGGQAEPAEQGAVLTTAAAATSLTSSAQEISASSTVVLAPTDTAVAEQPQAPVVQSGQRTQQPPVRQQADPVDPPVEPTGVPGNTLTTTPPTTTSRVPDMPWCRHPEHGWFSGVGQGCHEGNPYFVEYR
ncbi:hypothetical protein [Saccharothrix sp. HUAS TT1]|uniref:hypothetical protein n=1 Tax=unclassified Saccharothrix TaxID=2593673 RepID=UPI00345C0959